MAEGESGDKAMAAIAYVLTWVTGLIIFFVAKKEDKYARWHAVQAIGLGIATTVVYIILYFIPFAFLFSWIIWVAVLVLVVILAVKAYKGEKIRLPVIADFADKYA